MRRVHTLLLAQSPSRGDTCTKLHGVSITRNGGERPRCSPCSPTPKRHLPTCTNLRMVDERRAPPGEVLAGSWQ